MLAVAGTPTGPSRFTGLMALGAIGLLLFFVIVEMRRGDRALVPTALFSTPTVVGLNLVTLLLVGGIGAQQRGRARGNHLVMNAVHDQSGLAEVSQVRKALAGKPLPSAGRHILAGWDRSGAGADWASRDA